MQLVMTSVEKRRALLLLVLLFVFFERNNIADFFHGFYDGLSGVDSRG
jgi:hypothetical protein